MRVDQWVLDYMEKYPTKYVYNAAFNNLQSNEKVWKSLNAQCSPKELDSYFSQLGLEFDLISTLEQFHDSDIMKTFGDAIYNDSSLYNVPMHKLNHSTFLAYHIKKNYMSN